VYGRNIGNIMLLSMFDFSKYHSLKRKPKHLYNYILPQQFPKAHLCFNSFTLINDWIRKYSDVFTICEGGWLRLEVVCVTKESPL